MKWLPLLILIPSLGACDKALNEVRSDPCTLSLIDECKATLASGTIIVMTAYSDVETTVPHSNNLDECNKAARDFAYGGPTSFFTEGSGLIMAANALQPQGDYVIPGKEEVQFHYVKLGQADFRRGDETGAMSCTSRTHGSVHDL